MSGRVCESLPRTFKAQMNTDEEEQWTETSSATAKGKNMEQDSVDEESNQKPQGKTVTLKRLLHDISVTKNNGE